MGILSLLSRAFGSKKPEVKILIIGLDNSGKTTLVRKLNSSEGKEEEKETTPTVGFETATFQKNNLLLNVVDMSGSSRYRTLWESYYREAEAIIFVLDSADRIRMCVAKDELTALLEHDDIVNNSIPILIYANKMDLPSSLSPVECLEELELDSIENRPWHITSSNALTGLGLDEGIEWLSEQIGNKKKK